jgi:hypothetical protein
MGGDSILKRDGIRGGFLRGPGLGAICHSGTRGVRVRPVADAWSPNTKTAPDRSLNGRDCPFVRLHFISTSSAPSVSRSRSMYLDGPVEGGVSSSSHEHMN